MNVKFRRNVCIIFLATLNFLSPCASYASWSPGRDPVINDPHQIHSRITLNSLIGLHPGINNVTFFGLGPVFGPDAVGGADTAPLQEDGKITVLTDFQNDGCHNSIFLPSSADDVTQYWDLMPIGINYYNDLLPFWSSHSDNENCGNGSKKSLSFYRGSLDGVPTTFMVVSSLASSTIAASGRANFDILVFAFTKISGMNGNDTEPFLCLFGEYKTKKLYTNSDRAIDCELPTSDSQMPHLKTKETIDVGC